MNHSNDCFSHSTIDHHHGNSSSLYPSIIDNHQPVIVPLLRGTDLPTPPDAAVSSSSSAFSYHHSPYPPSESSTPGGQHQHSHNHQSNIISPYYPHPSSYGGIASPNIDFPPFWPSQWLFSSDIHQQTQDSIESALYCPSSTVTGCNQLANRLNPITQSPAVHHHQFTMPTNNQYSTRQYHHGAVRSNAPKKGGRRPKEYEGYEHSQLSEEDRDKRDKRRQRNKEAAARCRQRRLDLMQELQEQLNKMKCENDRQDEIIRSLKQQKCELEQLLRHHGCKNTEDEMCEPTTIVYQQTTRKRTASLLPPNVLPKIPKCEPTLTQVASEVENLQRPKSLSIGTAQSGGVSSSSLGTDSRWSNNNPAGVPITTPSSGLGPSCGGGGGGGDFMLLNQPTGLTPMSNNANLTALTYPSHTLATPLDHELKNL